MSFEIPSRLKTVNKKNYADELQAVNAMGKIRDRMNSLAERCKASGERFPNPTNSTVGYVWGITDAPPSSPPPIRMELDLPDIDIDFSDQHREEVIDYMKESYGEEHVSRLGTVALYRPKSALRETGGALGIPVWESGAMMDSVVKRSFGDNRADNTLEDMLSETPEGVEFIEKYPGAMIAARMEGAPRHSSQHASAVVLSRNKLSRIAPVDARSGAIQLDKKDAEDLNLLKVDVLGLTQLSIIEDTLELSEAISYPDLLALPLDDPKAYEILSSGRHSGIFQWNGLTVRELTSQLVNGIENFEDIAALTALARPGPLISGNADDWIKRKNGTQPVSYPHPLLEPYIRDTEGIVIYQEQVMDIGREIGGLSWEQVTGLRKAMSRSLGEEYFDLNFGNDWKAGAITAGIPEKLAAKIWKDLCSYGAWAFNKSHSVAYGIISYWCAYLKAYWPFEFAAATLNHEADEDRQREILRELVKEGYTYRPFDRKSSALKWSVGSTKDGGRELIGPLTSARGVGPKTALTILGARQRGEPLSDAMEKKLSKVKTPLDSLYPIRDGLARVCPDLSKRNIHSTPISIFDLRENLDNHDVLILGTIANINPRNANATSLVASRGYEIKGSEVMSLNIRVVDDSGSIFSMVNRRNYQRMGAPIIKRGRVGKALYAIKGTLAFDTSRKMMWINGVRYLGDMEDEEGTPA